MTTHSRLLDRWRHGRLIKIAALLAGALVFTSASATSSTTTAQAVEYHTNCVGHGWVAGASHSDGSAFSRVEAGCDSSIRTCKLYNYGTYLGGSSSTTTLCSAWLRDYGNYTECASYAKVAYPAVFSEHNHTPDDYCAGLLALAASRIQAVDPVGDQPLEDVPAYQPNADGAVLAVTAPDPRGGPDLGVRVYSSKTGLTCPAAGRAVGGRYGNLDENGRFRELGLDSDGACFDPKATPVGLVVTYRAAIAGQPAAAAVFGAAPTAKAITITVAGKAQQVKLGIGGAFIASADPEALAAGGTLTTTLADGSTPTSELPVGDLIP